MQTAGKVKIDHMRHKRVFLAATAAAVTCEALRRAVLSDSSDTRYSDVLRVDTTVVGTKNKTFYTEKQTRLPPHALDTEFDVAVVGGGIIGMATAREVLRRFPHMSVVVLEKEREVAPHQSSHNSGVIHAGMYYVPGSVMARTCVRGAQLMYEYCEANKLPHDRVGKLIVAVTPEEHKQVELLFQRYGTKPHRVHNL